MPETNSETSPLWTSWTGAVADPVLPAVLAAPQMKLRRVSLSVIISTFDRYADLALCLEALAPDRQPDAPEYEVLVIDQTPRSRRQPVSCPHARQIFQDVTGLSAGRNLGVEQARGELVAFLDDDSIAARGWVAAIAQGFRAPEKSAALAVGGRVLADWRRGARPRWMTEKLEAYLSCVDWSPEERSLNKGEWIVGANMAFRKSVFRDYGHFDAALGRKGNASLLSNEEVALLAKIGHEHVNYVPGATVHHIIQENRFQQSWFRKRVYWQAVSDLIAGSVHVSPVTARTNLIEFMTRCPAELRSIRALFTDFDEPEDMARQLRAIYAFVILGSDGFEPLFGLG